MLWNHESWSIAHMANMSMHLLSTNDSNSTRRSFMIVSNPSPRHEFAASTNFLIRDASKISALPFPHTNADPYLRSKACKLSWVALKSFCSFWLWATHPSLSSTNASNCAQHLPLVETVLGLFGSCQVSSQIKVMPTYLMKLSVH